MEENVLFNVFLVLVLVVAIILLSRQKLRKNEY